MVVIILELCQHHTSQELPCVILGVRTSPGYILQGLVIFNSNFQQSFLSCLFTQEMKKYSANPFPWNVDSLSTMYLVSILRCWLIALKSLTKKDIYYCCARHSLYGGICTVILKHNTYYPLRFILTYELEPSLGIDQAVFRYNFSQLTGAVLE